jgi:phosphoheptose isomerase
MPDQSQWMYDRARTHLMESAEIQQRVADQCLGPVIRAVALITEALMAGRKLLLCGNGGSAADCQHIAAEFVSTLSQDFKRPGLGAIALTTDTAFMTAYSNDYGFDGIFARQVEALGVPGDVLIGISTSGNSPNVLRALEVAKTRQMRSLVLTGASGRMTAMADVVIAVPCEKTPHIQESHITIGHILCDLVERSLFSPE